MACFHSLILVLCSIFVCFCQSSIKKSQYNKDVELVTLSLMQHFEIHNSIVIYEKNNDLKWQSFKIFSANYMPSLYLSNKMLRSYIIGGKFANVKTIIIYKEKNILNIKNLFQRLNEVSKVIFLINLKRHKPFIFKFLCFSLK